MAASRNGKENVEEAENNDGGPDESEPDGLWVHEEHLDIPGQIVGIDEHARSNADTAWTVKCGRTRRGSSAPGGRIGARIARKAHKSVAKSLPVDAQRAGRRIGPQPRTLPIDRQSRIKQLWKKKKKKKKNNLRQKEFFFFFLKKKRKKEKENKKKLLTSVGHGDTASASGRMVELTRSKGVWSNGAVSVKRTVTVTATRLTVGSVSSLNTVRRQNCTHTQKKREKERKKKKVFEKKKPKRKKKRLLKRWECLKRNRKREGDGEKDEDTYTSCSCRLQKLCQHQQQDKELQNRLQTKTEQAAPTRDPSSNQNKSWCRSDHVMSCNSIKQRTRAILEAVPLYEAKIVLTSECSRKIVNTMALQ